MYTTVDLVIFTRFRFSQIQEFRNIFNYYSDTKEKEKFANSKLLEKSKNLKFAKIQAFENDQIYSICFICGVCIEKPGSKYLFLNMLAFVHSTDITRK